MTQQRSTRNTDINYGNSGNRFDPRNPDRLGIFTFSSRTRKKKLYNNRFDILFRLTLFHAIPTFNSISRNPRLFEETNWRCKEKEKRGEGNEIFRSRFIVSFRGEMFARKRRKRDPFIALFESLHLYCGIQTLFKPAIPRVKWTFSSFLPLFPPLHPFLSSKDFDTERLATNKSALIKALVQPSTLCACTCVCVWLSRLAAVKWWTRRMFKRGWIVKRGGEGGGLLFRETRQVTALISVELRAWNFDFSRTCNYLDVFQRKFIHSLPMNKERVRLTIRTRDRSCGRLIEEATSILKENVWNLFERISREIYSRISLYSLAKNWKKSQESWLTKVLKRLPSETFERGSRMCSLVARDRIPTALAFWKNTSTLGKISRNILDSTNEKNRWQFYPSLNN